MKKLSEYLIGAILGVAIILGIVAYSAIVWGFVTFKFWHWFLAPVFGGLPTVSYLQAVGLWMFISLFRSTSGDTIKKEYKEDKNWPNTFLTPWVVLLFGYFIYCIIK